VSGNPRILFVDDDLLVLRGLQRALHAKRSEWDMVFVESGAKGLEEMSLKAFDVVVSDMRMPQMNGAEFLNAVKDRHPRTVRLVLSGHADKELILQCVGAAHQFLSKPCEPELLQTAISRVFESRPGIEPAHLKALLSHLPEMPTLPQRFRELQARLEDPDACLVDVANIIEADPGMSAKLLKLANSAFFGLRRQVASVEDALMHLGVEIVKSLLLLDGFLNQASPMLPEAIQLPRLAERSLSIGRLSRLVAMEEGCGAPDDAFTAGLLHKMGVVVLAGAFPARYEAEVLQPLADGKGLLSERELQAFGVDHAAVGGYLMALWGLPRTLVDGVALHLRPSLGPPLPSAATAVHLACAAPAPQAGSIWNHTLDDIHLAALTLRHPLSHWAEALLIRSDS
jgi:HD-like signal output (HDOD) protein/CheY-like chemotaxis protein